MRLIIISLTVLITTLVGLPPTQAEPLSETDRYELCSKSPYNSQCQGYQAPIAFADRPGEAGACILTINAVETQTICKLVINNDKITAYQEIGEPLQILKGKKASREIPLSPSAIRAIRYREDTKDNSTARAVNTFLFGLGGLFATRNKKIAEITIDYTMLSPVESAPKALPQPTATSESSSGMVTPPATTGSTTLKIVVRRKTGETLRQQLEQLTGLKTEMPPVEKRSQPETTPSEQGNR